jgi:hypothetical protein
MVAMPTENDYGKLIEVTGLSEWSHFIEIHPQLANSASAKAIFMCGFTQGCIWTSTLDFTEEEE